MNVRMVIQISNTNVVIGKQRVFKTQIISRLKRSDGAATSLTSLLFIPWASVARFQGKYSKTGFVTSLQVEASLGEGCEVFLGKEACL